VFTSEVINREKLTLKVVLGEIVGENSLRTFFAGINKQ
jgi:hypothetical protein